MMLCTTLFEMESLELMANDYIAFDVIAHDDSELATDDWWLELGHVALPDQDAL